jgi:hypothetical protein
LLNVPTGALTLKAEMAGKLAGDKLYLYPKLGVID